MSPGWDDHTPTLIPLSLARRDCCSYLYKSNTPGVQTYLANRLYTLPEEDLERYLSQFCQLCLQRPGLPVESVLVKLCEQSLRIAVKVRGANVWVRVVDGVTLVPLLFSLAQMRGQTPLPRKSPMQGKNGYTVQARMLTCCLKCWPPHADLLAATGNLGG